MSVSLHKQICIKSTEGCNKYNFEKALSFLIQFLTKILNNICDEESTVRITTNPAPTRKWKQIVESNLT